MGMIILANTGTTGVTVSSNVAANTEGSPATLKASTSAAVRGIWLMGRINSGTSRYYRVRIKVDGTTVAQFHFHAPNTSKDFNVYRHIKIPAGSALTATCEDTVGGGSLFLWAMGQTEESVVADMDTTCDDVSGGLQSLVCGTTPTWGSAVNFTATSRDLNHFAVDVLDVNTTSTGTVIRIYDDGVLIAENLYKNTTNGDGNYRGFSFYHPVASGSVISAEAMASSGTPTVRIAVQGSVVPALGGSSSTIIQGSGMQRILKDGETTAGRKRVFFDIRDTAGAGWTGSVTGVKAKLSTNGGTAADSTNDIVRVTTPLHYVELSDVEAAAASAGDVIAAWVPAGSGYLASTIGYLEITSENPTTQTVTDIANAVVEAEITAVKTYNRSANTTATIDGPVSGTNSLGVTVDATYQPIKTL